VATNTVKVLTRSGHGWCLTCIEVHAHQLTRLLVLCLQLHQGLLRVIARVLGQNLDSSEEETMRNGPVADERAIRRVSHRAEQYVSITCDFDIALEHTAL